MRLRRLKSLISRKARRGQEETRVAPKAGARDAQEPPLRNIKLLLEYEGTKYHGWQTQAGAGGLTVQEALEHALLQVTGKETKAVSSGRTDAGVHALGQVANFHTDSSLPIEAWAPVLNRVLPKDIRILDAEEAPGDFHARFSATGKVYRYLIFNRSAPSALERSRAWHVERPLNLTAMRGAARHLLGRHDFSAFRAAACTARTPIRSMRKIDIRRRGTVIEVTLEADAFLMHMARNIVGTLVETGLGRFEPVDVKRMLRSRNRSESGRTAPACGLYLVAVSYGGARGTGRRRSLKS